MLSRDACLWASLAVVAASIAVSAVDLHEQPHSRPVSSAPAASKHALPGEHETIADTGLPAGVGEAPASASATGFASRGSDAVTSSNAAVDGVAAAAAEGDEAVPRERAARDAPQTNPAGIESGGTAGAAGGTEAATDAAEAAAAPSGEATDRGGDIYPPPETVRDVSQSPLAGLTPGEVGTVAPTSGSTATAETDSGDGEVAPPAADQRAPALAEAAVREAMRTAAKVALPEAAHAEAPRPAGRWARLVGSDVDDELRCLALNVYWEARSEPALGRFAVAAVTLNRVGHRGFPNTICGVVRQGENLGLHRCQFSWVCDGKSNEPQNDEAWQEAENIAFSMLFLDLPDPTDGALWYHADYVSPGWAKAMARSARIGRHLFYRDAVREAGDAAHLAG